jgi:hypothetical protein
MEYGTIRWATTNSLLVLTAGTSTGPEPALTMAAMGDRRVADAATVLATRRPAETRISSNVVRRPPARNHRRVNPGRSMPRSPPALRCGCVAVISGSFCGKTCPSGLRQFSMSRARMASHPISNLIYRKSGRAESGRAGKAVSTPAGNILAICTSGTSSSTSSSTASGRGRRARTTSVT